MRKWVAIGIVSFLVVATVGGGAYWFFSRTGIATQASSVEVVGVESVKDNGSAESSDVIEPLVVQGQHNPPAPDDADGLVLRTDLPAPALRWHAEMPLPPRPDAQSGVVERMPMADEEPGVGIWFFLDWSAIKAKLRTLNIFKEIEKADTVPESGNNETKPPTEPPSADPVSDYHQQHPHCPRYHVCPSSYRQLPRD